MLITVHGIVGSAATVLIEQLKHYFEHADIDVVPGTDEQLYRCDLSLYFKVSTNYAYTKLKRIEMKNLTYDMNENEDVNNVFVCDNLNGEFWANIPLKLEIEKFHLDTWFSAELTCDKPMRCVFNGESKVDSLCYLQSYEELVIFIVDHFPHVFSR